VSAGVLSDLFSLVYDTLYVGISSLLVIGAKSVPSHTVLGPKARSRRERKKTSAAAGGKRQHQPERTANFSPSAVELFSAEDGTHELRRKRLPLPLICYHSWPKRDF